MRRLLPLILLGLFFAPCTSSLAGSFPYRELYPELQLIELNELKSVYDKGDYIIVDVRSPAEFDTIHISNAVNLPYTNTKFTSNLRRLAQENPGKKIAVYCNGITCIKSYKAAEDALYAGLQNVYAFDAGIKKWAETYPDCTIFNGQPMNAEKLIASEKRFTTACLEYELFKAKSVDENVIVIDARDPMQRKQPLPGMDKALQIPLDKLVNNIVKKGHMKDKNLLIFDQVGKQVNWLMFHLEDNGYTDYHFLAGGATAVLKVQDYR